MDSLISMSLCTFEDSVRKIAVLSAKGGAGKTTVAINLAVSAEHAGHATVLIDLDLQASACRWQDVRQDDAPAVVSAHAARLPQLLETAANKGADFVVIDTAPHTETASLAAARSADFCVLPCRPASLDLYAISTTIDIVRLAGVEACLLLNAVPARSTLSEDAQHALALYSVPVAPITLGQRVAYVHSLTAGQSVPEWEPRGKAACEIKALYTYIEGRTNHGT